MNVWRLLRAAFDVGVVLLDDSDVTSSRAMILINIATIFLIHELYGALTAWLHHVKMR